MRICGVIAEYDPLHNGHAWHLSEARRRTGADLIVCVMSGSFTQRGMPALLSPHTRAEMALRAGADLVLQLPVSFSVCEGERFAMGGAAILRQVGAEYLCFGAEPEGIPVLEKAAAQLEEPGAEYQARLHALLNEGMAFPAAQGQALAESLGAAPVLLAQPNTALAICYLRAIHRLRAQITPVPVPRSGSYHAEDLQADCLPSATAVRAACLGREWEKVKASMPEESYALLQAAFQSGQYHLPDALTPLLRWKLRQGTDFSRLPGLSEGIENRLQLAANGQTREEMVLAVKSKRYSYARINRLLAHVLLDTDARRLEPLPRHALVLGFRKGASGLLKNSADESFSFISQMPAHPPTYEMQLDARADDLWNLGANQPFGAIYRQKPVIL